MKLPDVCRDLKDAVLGTAMLDAIDAAAPLLAEFGISLQVVNKRLVRGQSEHIRLCFERDPAGVVLLSMSPLDYTEQCVEGNETLDVAGDISLSIILHIVAPDVQFAPRYARSSKKMREEIKRQVRVLIQYCRPMLEGDFSAWPSIVKFGRILWSPAGGETMEVWTSKMKQILSDLLQRKDYLLASQVCLSLRPQRAELTREEMDACRLADREVERMRRE